ncbi:MAG: hypothetical protein HQL21_01735 [Candidatus Omnitrophica bacterium]|nr:hypothetical protein [Candidatus Omnitrophota bacterium]
MFKHPSYAASDLGEDSAASLLSLPYIDYVKTEKEPNKAGTTIYKKDKAFSGYSIYTSDMKPDGFVNLIDMDGKIVHRWARRNPQSVKVRWEQVTPFPDGSIFLSCHMGTIDWQWVDVNSHCIDVIDMPGQSAHHGAYYLKDGGFLGLVSNMIYIPFRDLMLKVQDNSLVRVSSDGRTLKKISLRNLFAEDLGYHKKLGEFYDYQKDYLTRSSRGENKKPKFDPFHANNIVNLEWDIPGIAKKGDWLVTVRHLDRIFIVAPEQERIVWQWGENIISHPHHATFLTGDQILLFDNGSNKKSSRIIVVDIRSGKIVWQYGQKPGQEFFSNLRGSAQRLPNGNTLIADSDSGRAFEVTISGEVVWEWYVDFLTEGNNKGKRRAVSRIQRVPYDFFKGVQFNYGKIDP